MGLTCVQACFLAKFRVLAFLLTDSSDSATQSNKEWDVSSVPGKRQGGGVNIHADNDKLLNNDILNVNFPQNLQDSVAFLNRNMN